MEDNFRNALIIISAVVIAAIFIHGFWTIRKNKNPYKLKTKVENLKPMDRGYDGSGFDQDGVSKARIVSENALSDEEIPDEPAPAPLFDAEPIPKDLEQAPASAVELAGNEALTPNTDNIPELDAEYANAVQNEQELFPQPIVPESQTADVSSVLAVTSIEKEPQKDVYQTPVTRAKPVLKPVTKKNVTHRKKEVIKRNQMEINFGDSLAFEDEAMPAVSIAEDLNTKKSANIDPEVLVVSVVMDEGQIISGAALLPTLLTLGMRFGDMDIFHRHEDNAGNGKVTFSLANMMNPGTFNLDAIETFTTQGITLFMTLPNAGNAFEVFEQMIGAAKQLALEFQGQLLDDKRSVMTKQTEQHYTSKIREFERKSRIAAS
ncbi:MAG: cell division protein ZipA [Colwellia sp.]|nr:cell division protein ZipA [Colwellia sp.]